MSKPPAPSPRSETMSDNDKPASAGRVLTREEWDEHMGTVMASDHGGEIIAAENRLRAHDAALRERLAEKEREIGKFMDEERLPLLARMTAAEARVLRLTKDNTEMALAWAKDMDRAKELEKALREIDSDRAVLREKAPYAQGWNNSLERVRVIAADAIAGTKTP